MQLESEYLKPKVTLYSEIIVWRNLIRQAFALWHRHVQTCKPGKQCAHVLPELYLHQLATHYRLASSLPPL